MKVVVKKCDFCGLLESQVGVMFESKVNNVCICDECIHYCCKMLDSDSESSSSNSDDLDNKLFNDNY